jgi:predicted nucleotidyltransferase component of viral defense system
MISEHELRRIAGRGGVGIGQAEHEYVVLCALDALSQVAPLSKTFCLKGGTALSQLYFPNWRHSVDLDFSVLPSFPEDRLRAQFIGPLRHPNRLLLDVTLDEPVILPPQRRGVVTELFAYPQPTVLVYALEEILAEKLRSLLERGKARDYYDVWRLLKEEAEVLDLSTVRWVLREKCRHKGLTEPTVEAFLEASALEEAEAYWSQDLIGQTPGRDLPAWEAVITELAGLLSSFFSSASPR